MRDVATPARGPAAPRRWLATYSTPLLAFLLARVGLFLLAAWGVTSSILAAEKPAGSFLLLPLDGWAALLIEPWTRWDGQWYLKIVEQGYGLERYVVEGREVITHASTAFFPLYPAIVWIVSRLPGISAPVAGIAVSTLATLGAVLVVYRLIWREFGTAVAGRTVRYLLIFPTAFFFFAVYTEGLFLLVSSAALLCSRERRWWLAGLFGALAAATRLNGLLVLIPLAIDYVVWLRGEQRRPEWEAGAFVVPFAGVAAYLIFLQYRFGNALAFLEAQRNIIWNRRALPPWELLLDLQSSFDVLRYGPLPVQRVNEAVRIDLYYGGYGEFDGMNFVFWFGALVVALASFRRIPLGWSLYALAMVLLPLGSPVPGIPLQSLPRYILPVFPLFVMLALWGTRPVIDRAIAYPFLVLLGIFTVRFATWYWVG